MGVLFYETVYLADLKILSEFLFFDILNYNLSLHESFWVHLVWETLLPVLGYLFPSLGLGKFSAIISPNKFSIPFFFFLGTLVRILVCLMLSQRYLKLSLFKLFFLFFAVLLE